MSIATGTGLAIAGIASGVGGLVSAKMQSSAANKAAKIQSQAAQNQQQYIQQGMAQLGQMYAPYMNIGSQATNTLGRLLTPPAGARYASPGPTTTTPGMAMPQNPSIGMANYGTPGGGYQQTQPMPGYMQMPSYGAPYGGNPYMASPQYYGNTFSQMAGSPYYAMPRVN